MKIEIWSDFVCPFCYIGKRELEKAIQTLGLENDVEIEMKAYELDPTTDPNSDERTIVSLARKMNMTEEQAIEASKGIVDRAASLGLNYDYAKMQSANTKKAHQVAKFAAQNGQGLAFNEALLKAHFTDHLKLNDTEVLADIAEQLGLSRSGAIEAAESSELAYEVHQDVQEGTQLGAKGVPFFVFDRKLGIAGAQPQQMFIDTLKQAAEEAGLSLN